MAIPAAAQRSGRLTGDEVAAWLGFLRAHTKIIRTLDQELEAECGLSLAQYDVLAQLSAASERQLRMTELADRVLLSRSGLTRLVDRLEGMGLVERQACPSDARGMYARLTDLGRERLRAASGPHLRGVREHVTGRLSQTELRRLADLMGRLLAER
ncbi:MAG TPA: MarR family transcriptional regulator [Mycobacteriales bacterium]|nr:MarR family transcriptional regulator [Mycobacteriales bacterium]